MTRGHHIALVVIAIVVLVLVFLVIRPGVDETDPEQSSPPTATATP
ncbi:hypothetical protein DVA67_027250 [Solirubrobacter sp. CPCC 204708]|uniref:Uncharacterized protein n=1 Tax=Solirubrobacter deserti TaxID=2282478 RepID=A0ABT4RGB5_9ACTN|nr:hypothetical protein [Solirubrobacter deserti]MBE2319696.1 hypothetical protein [Solirubrobacter deserti]MDA0137564.1 hypothetical protein [Solirubrobacter deserti]